MPALRRSLLSAAISLFLSAACAATASAAPGHSGGVIGGRVIDKSRGLPVAGVKVHLVGADQRRGVRIEHRTVTNGRGSFRFSHLPTGPLRTYSLSARHDEGYFTGASVTFSGSTTRARRNIAVWRTTERPSVMRVAKDDVYIVQSKAGLAALESVTFVNTAPRAYIGRARSMLAGPAARSAGPIASFGFALPPDTVEGSISISRTDLELPRVQGTTFGFGIINAIPPGTHSILFSYQVADSGGGTYSLTRPALYPTRHMSVYAADPLIVNGAGIRGAGRVTSRGQTFTKWTSSSSLAPLDQIELTAAARGGITPGLAGGLGVALIVLLAAGGFALRRSRRPVAPPGRAPNEPLARVELIAAVAELDLAYDDGRVSQGHWQTRRAELKRRLATESSETVR